MHRALVQADLGGGDGVSYVKRVYSAGLKASCRPVPHEHMS